MPYTTDMKIYRDDAGNLYAARSAQELVEILGLPEGNYVALGANTRVQITCPDSTEAELWTAATLARGHSRPCQVCKGGK